MTPSQPVPAGSLVSSFTKGNLTPFLENHLGFAQEPADLPNRSFSHPDKNSFPVLSTNSFINSWERPQPPPCFSLPSLNALCQPDIVPGAASQLGASHPSEEAWGFLNCPCVSSHLPGSLRSS